MEMTTNDNSIQMAPPPYAGVSQEGGVSVVEKPSMEPSVGVTIVQQPTAPPANVVVVHGHMGPQPTGTICRSCNQQIVTKVEMKASTKTHLFACILCLVFCPCVCLPYCIDSCQTANHYCPNCNAYIGSDSS